MERLDVKHPAVLLTGALFCVCLSVLLPASLQAASMGDYCVTPPFVSSGVNPNLLLIIDNSASMYDLAYVDKGVTTAPVRTPYYCYDNTYSSSNSYPGYFDKDTFYKYDLGSDTFQVTATFPSSCTKRTADTLCLDLNSTTPRSVAIFIAKGNYLNWLSASKFDIEKKILTGGKYNTANNVLVAESRGCVGRRYVKEALTANYVEGGTNTSLGITFGVRGPVNTDNPTRPSSGGQTYIEVFDGNFNESICQTAINDFINDAGLGTLKADIKSCLSYPLGASKQAKEGVVFNQSVQACWALKKGTPLGNDELNTVHNQCPDVYAYYSNGPADISPSNPAYLCSSAYTGACYDNPTKTWTREYNGNAGDVCILKRHEAFCNQLQIPAVIDPTDAPSDTGVYDNLPAIISDTGVLAQLSSPIKIMTVKVQNNSSPGGVIQKFNSTIRIGAMAFNNHGSVSECYTVTNNGSNVPCPASGTNVDGGKVVSYIGDPVGDHSSGLINTIDNIAATTWTPFTEAFYNAIGYFANRTDLRLNSGDFDSVKNPSQYTCQRNNILLISDGMSTADRNAVVNNLVSSYNDGDGQTGATDTCPKYAGSRDLDDMAWLAKNRNIKDFTKTPQKLNEYITSYVVFTGTPTNDAQECNPEILMRNTASNGGTSYYKTDNYYDLEVALDSVLKAIAGQAVSGTALSVLASSEGSGANLTQAVFYPSRKFGDTEIKWTGEMQDLWYYLDPWFQNSAIREDTTADKVLNLSNDYKIAFSFNSSESRTKVNRYKDTNNDGIADTFQDTVNFEDLNSLWKAGSLLWARDLSTSPRTVYTTINGSSFLVNNFSVLNKSNLQPYLLASGDTEAEKIINYVHGIDQPGYRNRTVTIGGSPAVWKLGDIISSTPRVQSSQPLNSYHLAYNDLTYADLINTSSYKNNGMVYVGANDGMLHAFYLGKLELNWTGQGAFDKARLTDPSGTGFGKEIWAFIPKSALPYLKYTADQAYCHLYYVDATPYILDASIASPDGCSGNYWGCTKDKASWRTVLIGSMGLGGACRNYNSDCTDCVKTPADSSGYSSYFALDVTDPQHPTLLWEFSDPSLGFSTTGPAVVRIGDSKKNGRWFAVLGSGPTGPVSGGQFLGRSDQNLKLFVLDLKTGALVRTMDTGIGNAFAGSLFNASIDTDRSRLGLPGNYSDDIFYLGYVKKSGDLWNDGGVYRVITKEDNNPANWTGSKLIEGIGPVTTAIAKLQDTGKGSMWLYFGTGRYFFKQGNTIDDADSQRAIYGIKEPCYSKSANDIYTAASDISGCTYSPVSSSDLKDQTLSPTGSLADTYKGWHINLGATGTDYKAERVITDPLAAFSGVVFFTTFSPNADVCSFGGSTYLWAVRYDTGSQAAAAALQGKALVQVSTGSVEEVDLSSAFTAREHRRTSSAITGVPPKGQGLSVVIRPKPVKRFLHIREK